MVSVSIVKVLQWKCFWILSVVKAPLVQLAKLNSPCLDKECQSICVPVCCYITARHFWLQNWDDKNSRSAVFPHECLPDCLVWFSDKCLAVRFLKCLPHQSEKQLTVPDGTVCMITSQTWQIFLSCFWDPIRFLSEEEDCTEICL